MDEGRHVAAQVILRKPDVDQMGLQKLLYLIQAANLVWHGRPAFSDQVKAYKHGPVVPWVEREYRVNTPGGTPIGKPTPEDIKDLDETVSATIDAVLAEYGDLSSTELTPLTKKPGSPWAEIRGDLPADAHSSRVIPQDLILGYHRGHGVFRGRELTEHDERAFERILAGDDLAVLDLLS